MSALNSGIDVDGSNHVTANGKNFVERGGF